ncbi:MAG: DUF4214 domain-containing protein, partial [Oscillospiraceae bacterium]|nr:DUF4214 domain-containing protein [Oscillospiraceae bacterium]
MKTRMLKIAAALLTAVLLFTLFPFTKADVSAAEGDQEIREFVTRLYKVCLKRDPDEGGLNYWVGELKDQKETGVAVASGFIFSTELQSISYSNEDYVKVMYDAFFGREADTEGLNYWVKCMNDGMTRQEIFTGFANSSEFFDLCGSFGIVAGTYIPKYASDKVSRTNFFVERLNKVVLGRSCDKDGMMYWTEELLSGRISGTSAAYGFFFSAEYEGSNKFYSEYINDLYNAMMGREADDSGRDFWIGDMKKGVTKEQVFNGFAMSAEFKGICSDYGIQQGGKISEDKNTTNTLRPDGDKSNSNGSSSSSNSNNGSSSSNSGSSNSGNGNSGSNNGSSSSPATPSTSPSGSGVTPVNTDVSIKNSNLTIMNGCSDLIQFTDKNGIIVKVDGATFKSDNDAIVYACPDGTVVGLSEGSAIITVNYAGNTSCVYVKVEKYISTITHVPNALTPQDFNAAGDGKTDDTKAFRKMFEAAIGNSYKVDQTKGWQHCQSIYIPSGKYLISGSIFDENLTPTNKKALQ